MKISRQGEYGLAAILFLASQPEGKLSLREEIARRCGIPENFLARILVRLRQEGILGARRGARGGYFLKVEPQRLTLGDVLEALEGKLRLLKTRKGRTARSRSDWGSAGRAAFERLQQRANQVLRSMKIRDFLPAKGGH